jgi:hypothetical protein
MLGISLRYLDIVGGGSSAGDVSLAELLGSKNSPTEAGVARHGSSASKVQRSSILVEETADNCNKLKSRIHITFLLFHFSIGMLWLHCPCIWLFILGV